MFISNKSHGFTVYHSSSVTSFPLSLAFFYSVEIKSHSKMLNSGHFCPHNPVYVRCFDPSVLVFSLSLYRHPSLCILFSSHFTSFNKQLRDFYQNVRIQFFNRWKQNHLKIKFWKIADVLFRISSITDSIK